MRFIVIAALVVLSGCASSRYRKEVQSYIGKPEGEVIARFGAPSSTYQSGKSKFLTYSSNSGAVAMPMGSSAIAVPRQCRTTFEVNELLIVASARADGNACQ